MEFRLLGPVEARAGDDAVPLGGPKPRALLTALLLERGRPVTVHRLVEAIWGERPPITAPALVQSYVSGLRRRLHPDGVIVTTAWGYQLDVPPEAVDRDVFERLLSEGRLAAASRRQEEAAELYGRAVELWRGPALGGPDNPVLERAAARLDELRLEAVEGRTAALLALDRLDGLADRLAGLVAQHPARERLRAQLMTTLHREGRRADALAVFREGRRVLVDDLGVEPGAELSAVHLAILREEQERAGPAQPAPARLPVPAQLPACPIDFTGRKAELAAITAALTVAAGRRGLPIHVVTGGGGLGKSTLAVRAAHELAAEFPDGQLFADLLGVDDNPVEPAAVLGHFLRALGAAPAGLPAAPSELAAQFRSMLAGRRVLLVLDDAAGVRQLAPLLPGSPSCAVLVTSRQRLGGLPGAGRTRLDALPEEPALTLLERIVGADRVAAAPEAALRLLTACERVPLAIRVAGARLAARPGWSLRTLADRVADESRRLDELSDGAWGMRAILEQSFRGLDPLARNALRALGSVRATRFSARRLGALLDLPEAAADAVATRLADAHLLDFDLDGYRLPALVRLYAAEQAVPLRPAAGF